MRRMTGESAWQQGMYGSILLVICTLTIVLNGSVLADPGYVSGDAGTVSPVNLTILAVNDFHGQITTGMTMNGSPVGSAGVMAAYLMQAIEVSGQNHTIIAIPGDFTGASPPESGILLDEPTLLYLNLFGGNTTQNPRYKPIASCPIIATVGNHEFDQNLTELNRKITGGNGTTTIPHLQDPYPGFDGTVILSNVVINESGKTLFTPSTVRTVDGIPVAFIGAVTNETPHLVTAGNVKGLTFFDEADSINAQVRDLKRKGLHAFVILLHEGGTQTPYIGATQNGTPVTGKITDIVSRLDSDVDIVLSGHTHQFTNAYLPNAGGYPVLVTQAYSYSKGFANISLTLDPATRDISWKSASIEVPYADRPPGNTPEPESSLLLNDTLNLTGPILNQGISRTNMNITTRRNADGESNLYDLVTDSMRTGMKTDAAVINEGAVRANITPGNITVGNMYLMLPFANDIITVTMTGEQIRLLLEQQWTRTIRPDHLLQISGIRYTYDDSKPPGSRVLSISVNQTPVTADHRYSVATLAFLTGGGDGYTVMKDAEPGIIGPMDVDLLISYIRTLPIPLVINPDGRILRVSPTRVTVTGVRPEMGAVGETVPVTISGENFIEGAAVTLENENDTITGDTILVRDPGHITATFALPESAVPGYYQLIVKSPSEGTGVLTNAFMVNPREPPTIIRVSPGTIPSGKSASLVIQGRNFMPNATVTVHQNDTSVAGKHQVWASNRTISESFEIPAGLTGEWNVTITNPDGQSEEKTGAFMVRD